MVKKAVTIDDLAIMVQKGFKDTTKKAEMDFRFGQVDKRFDQMDKRFDKIENMILIDHLRRIEKLEKQVDELKNALAI